MKNNFIDLFFKFSLYSTFSFPFSFVENAQARVQLPDSFSLKEKNKTFEYELESDSFSFGNSQPSLNEPLSYSIPLKLWNKIFDPALKNIENSNKIFFTKDFLWKSLSKQKSPNHPSSHTNTKLICEIPKFHNISIAEAPFKEFQRHTKDHRYHSLVEELKAWLEEINSLNEFKLTPDLANYWNLRIMEEFVNSNGILKNLNESSQYQINLKSRQGIQTASWINHLLIVQKKVDSALIHQTLNTENSLKILSNNDSLSLQRERYLKESDKIIALILDLNHNYKNKLTPEEIDAIVSTHISLGERLEQSPQELETLIHNFLENHQKKIPVGTLLNELQLELWHSLQNFLRRGPLKESIPINNKLIGEIKYYLKTHTCRNTKQISVGLEAALNLTQKAQDAFENNNTAFAQELLNQSHKVLAFYGSLALQISSDTHYFKNEN